MIERLYARWQAHLALPRVRLSSRPEDLVRCPAYEGMIALGRAALPEIVERMRAGEASGWKESEFLLWRAASRIAGVDLSVGGETASEQEMARRLIRWWDRNGA